MVVLDVYQNNFNFDLFGVALAPHPTLSTDGPSISSKTSDVNRKTVGRLPIPESSSHHRLIERFRTIPKFSK